ncbi:MAG TPA: hypothetical protein VHQ86_03040, partial [Candidatus Saccharimonadia bacterium]|nr:hypothetical protein [Candidatus Saccharimonadia bacterium]
MSSLGYIAILGRQPELGLVELESVLETPPVAFGRQAALIDSALELGRLGGALKLGEVLYRGAVKPLRELPLDVTVLATGEGRVTFGLSAYGVRETPRALAAAGLELKKRLKARGSVRLVQPSRGLALSAAELAHNHVLEGGFELLVVSSGREMVVARTIAHQDVDWYSKRDYGRPARSAKVGMLPPKLAQILVNTTHASMVADPFCGTGVILQEALLLGREAQGSDIALEMVTATRENLTWLQEQAPVPLPAWDADPANARTVQLPKDCAVVSEGYLGPNLSKAPAQPQLAEIKRDLLG